MSRIFAVDPEELKSEELAKLVRKVQALAGNGYDIIHENYEPFVKPYQQILRLAKKEKEWYLYFDTINEILYLNRVHHKYDEVVKYAELYYKESALYMDRELPNYPEGMAYINMWIYNNIFVAYYQYHQIDDAKMDIFMKKYKESALKYGKTYLYYEDEMDLSLLYRDADRAKEAARNFRLYEKDIRSCYVCAHRSYLAHLLLTGEIRQAEEMLCDFVNKNIPKQHLWCYDYCKVAVADSMYESVLNYSLMSGNEEAFCYFFTKYWAKVPQETQTEGDWAFRRLLCAYAGLFDRIEDDIQEAEECIKDEQHETTVGNIEIDLRWWCYFTLLDRSGVHEIETGLPGLETSDVKTKGDVQTADGGEGTKVADGTVKVPTLAVAAYMEKRADEFGALFSKARARFDYEGLKATYRNCFLAEGR